MQQRLVVRLFLSIATVCILAVPDLMVQAQAPVSTQAPVGKYVGPGSCSAAACHGSVRPAANAKILQNEYSTWILQDKHAQAHKVLTNSVSQRMGRILGIGAPEQAQKCLACHALSVPADKKGRDFDITEGVSCENCHGPASGWLGQHTVKGWTTAQSVALGMVDTANISTRAEQCLTCHLGTAEKFVDHEMIAAGHPDLVFELDSYSSVMPPHWKKPEDSAHGARVWSVGQAVKLREGLERLARRAQGPTWPEYAEMECFACHHDLTKAENSWRQARGYANRRPGNAPWNAAHYSVLRVALKEMDASLAETLEKDLANVFALASKLNADRNEIARVAGAAAATANQAAQKLNALQYDRDRAGRMARAIVAEADDLSAEGTRTAEQAAMAIEALLSAQGQRPQKQVRALVDGLFKQLENPSAYSGPRFANELKRVGASIR